MLKKSNKKSGMAILITMSMAIILFILGMSFLKSFIDTASSSRAHLDRIQADYFARGIQNIALFKIKHYPDMFLRAYKMKIYKERRDKDDTLPPFKMIPDEPAKAKPVILDPTKPFENFLTDGCNREFGYGGILMNNNKGDTGAFSSFIAPLTSIASYSTDIKLYSTEEFRNNFIEITVFVNTIIGGRNITTPYKITVDMERSIK